MRTTNYLKLSALVLGSAIAGCSGNNTASTGPSDGGTNSAGGTTNAGGASGVGGTKSTSATGVGGAGVGGNATGGAGVGGNATGGLGVGGNATGGAGVGGNATGGTKTNTGGANVGGNATGGAATGGANVGGNATGGAATGGANVGGNATGGTKTNTGGANVGGNATGGTPPATGGTATGVGGGTGCTPAANVLSDFESGKGTLYPVPTSATTGFWYVYKDTSSGSPCTGTQVPTAATDAAVAATALPTTDSRYGACNKYAMHSSITTCPTYSGFGAALHPTPGSKVNVAVDMSTYDGITFWMKAGTGTQGPLYMEMQSQECAAPPPDGGGTAKSQAIDMYNCHGKLFSTIPTAWTQVWVPFGTTGPRWFPTVTTSSSGKTCTATDFCEVPQLVTPHMLSIQFSLEDPFNSQATAYANYDVWIDDVAGFNFADTSHAGVAAPSSWMSGSPTNPFPQNKTYSGCAKPTGADGWLIGDAYVNWKKNFVRADGANQKVISPEIDSGASVSEGIAYGMLIAVYMGDKALFDGLYGYWKAHAAVGALMNWKIASGGSTSGSGSATDSDEDAAFAVLEASKQWPSGGYSATGIIGDIWNNDIDKTSFLPTGGSNYGNSTTSHVTNPSYFAPAMYREFAKVDTGHAWSSVISAVYTAFSSGIGNAVTSGLVSAWCSNNCTTTGTNGAATDTEFQYDSHRVPWRLGIDTCWNGTSTGSAYLSKLIGFFNTQSDTEGLSNLEDIYQTSGTKDTTNGANNSMSLIGCAGVGAMATGTTGFRDRAWQFLLEGQYTANPTFVNGVSGGTKPGYTYYNATVGLLTMMTMTGNFYVM